MSKNNREELDIYVIPPNFIESGKLFGGMFKMRNAIEAGTLAGVCAFFLFKLPVSLTGKIIILCFTSPNGKVVTRPQVNQNQPL